MKVIVLTTFLLISLLTFTKVGASGDGYPPGCEAPGIPTACPRSDQYEPDLKCINSRFIDPSIECCQNKCKGGDSIVGPGDTLDPSQDTLSQLNIFGTKIALNFANTQTIPTLTNLGISTFLGIVSLYALFRGIYVGAVIRANQTDPTEIAKVNKELTNMMIGFLLAWGAIFIVQLISNLLGLGSLQNLQVGGTDGAIVITIV